MKTTIHDASHTAATEHKSRRTLWWSLVLLLPVAALPLGFPGAGEMGWQEACADGTCCPEHQSICNIGGGDNPNYYKKACDGSCYQACPDT